MWLTTTPLNCCRVSVTPRRDGAQRSLPSNRNTPSDTTTWPLSRCTCTHIPSGTSLGPSSHSAPPEAALYCCPTCSMSRGARAVAAAAGKMNEGSSAPPWNTACAPGNPGNWPGANAGLAWAGVSVSWLRADSGSPRAVSLPAPPAGHPAVEWAADSSRFTNADAEVALSEIAELLCLGPRGRPASVCPVARMSDGVSPGRPPQPWADAALSAAPGQFIGALVCNGARAPPARPAVDAAGRGATAVTSGGGAGSRAPAPDMAAVCAGRTAGWADAAASGRPDAVNANGCAGAACHIAPDPPKAGKCAAVVKDDPNAAGCMTASPPKGGVADCEGGPPSAAGTCPAAPGPVPDAAAPALSRLLLTRFRLGGRVASPVAMAGAPGG